MASDAQPIPLQLDPLVAEARRRAVRRRLLALGFLVIAAAATAITLRVTRGPGTIHTSPPSGLSAYGRAEWNLDALLHDNFGTHEQVWLNTRASYPRTPANFSPRSIDLARSSFVLYTFTNAHDSAFTLVAHPSHPPVSQIGASGWDAPLTLRGSYISCGGTRWLYEHGGEAAANWWVRCLSSP
jgi:hypothetical protein